LATTTATTTGAITAAFALPKATYGGSSCSRSALIGKAGTELSTATATATATSNCSSNPVYKDY
jgi:hypothetical protein